MKHSTQTVQIGNLQIGGPAFAVIAGPCSIESEAQFLESAQGVHARGACLLRGGIYKMRTNPNSFQGLGREAAQLIQRVKDQVGLGLVSEITDPRQISDMADIVDVFQVGSRNMYNYALLKELASLNRPVLLKRGFSATVEEWLLAADYLVKGGNTQVILCERGIRTFETTTRNTLDLNSVAYLKAHAPYPVIVDPSHGTGRRELIAPLAMAAAAVGADGVIIEVHPRPDEALSDAFQALDLKAFDQVMTGLEKVLSALGRPLGGTQ